VEGLTPGLYHYLPWRHGLKPETKGEHRSALAAAALGQDYLRDNSAVVVFVAVYERSTEKYGRRGMRYVHISGSGGASCAGLQATTCTPVSERLPSHTKPTARSAVGEGKFYSPTSSP
jgi:hypothetical protein